MGYAMHRIPAHPAAYDPRAPFVRDRLRAIAEKGSNSLASAALVLESALAFRQASALQAAASTPNAEAGFDAAVRLYERGHWEQAFIDLAVLADQGHAPAAKLALLMLRYGAAVYGAAFEVRPGQVARWAQRVLRASSPLTSRATASPSSITAIA